jgi:hypothetical protein
MKITYYLLLFILILKINHSYSQIQFSPYINIVTNSWPEVVAIDDVNNDGLNDVVLGTKTYGNSINDYKILVFIQNNNGTLNTPIAYPYNSNSSGISSIDIIDINNDNLKDVIIGFDNKVGIFYQNSNNTLNTIFEIDTNTLVKTLKTKDLNNDGLNDIVIGTSGSFFKIYYQTSSNNFNEISYSKPSVNFDEVEIGDINSDNKLDIIFITKNSSTFYVYYQNNTNSFDNYTNYTFSSQFRAISVGDINNDGKNDVAITRGGNSPNSKVLVFFQNSTTHLLNNPIEIQAYEIPEPIEIDDLNNDGLNEIIVVHGGWLKLSVYQQNGTLFNPYQLFDIPYASHYNNQGMDIGDINNDGRKDIAIADYNYGLVILYNTSTLSNTSFEKGNLFIFPNPVYDSFEIKSDFSSSFSYEIYDIHGKKLKAESIENSNPINISQFEKGIYFIRVKSENRVKNFKILKN